MKRLIGVAIVFGLFVSIGAAQAEHLAVNDAADARGPLDVKRVGHAGGNYPTWNIKTYGKWSRRKILDQGFIAIYLDTFGDERHDYYALVWADKKRIRGTLMRDRKEKSDYAVRAVRVRHPFAKTAKVTVGLPKLRIGDDRATYNWYVQTLWSSSRCKQVCFDWAPDIGKDGGGIEEPLPLTG